jgi:pimeloyl-ACP methyl ester carboxylesterase/putative sterol carrier protein
VPEQDLLPLLDERLRGRYSQLLADTVATIELTDGARAHWTVAVDRGRISARSGPAEPATTRVVASQEVLGEVVQGRRSGVRAFLDGDLQVRGNLALALQMDGLFVGAGGDSDHLVRTRQVRAGGVETVFLETGPADAPPVVLIHGLGATNASMLPLLPPLAERYRVLAPDLPGHGASVHGRDTYAASFLGGWLLSFLEQTCDQPAVLIGNSLGGRTSLEAGLLSPAAVRALVLLCPAVAFRKLRQFVPFVRLLRPELAALPMPVPRPMATAGLRQLFAVPSRLPDAWYDSAIDEFLRVMKRPTGRVAFFSALRQIYLDRAFGEDGFWDRLPSLVPPALFIWGDKDVLVPAGFARHVEKAVPAAESIVLDNCGHVPQFELPERTARLALDFLDALPSSQPGDERPRRLSSAGSR